MLNINSQLSKIPKLSPDHSVGLKKLRLETINDLLRHFPTRYADMREVAGTENVKVGSAVTIYGIMEKVSVRRSFRGHMPMTEARIADNSGTIRCIWFNQAYIGKMYPDGTRVKISGIIQKDSRGLFLSNPNIERTGIDAPENQNSLFAKNVNTEFLTPIYKETKGVSSLFLYTLIKKIIFSGALDEITDPIPEHILQKLNLPTLREAILYIHFPKSENLTIAARKRFAFEEIFFMQIKHWKEKIESKNSLAYAINVDEKDISDFIKNFSFTPTNSQLNAIKSITKDIKKKEPMGRLLEGDVGSGKTFVAGVIANSVINTHVGKNGQRLQVAFMAPTSILANQHFENFIKLFNLSAMPAHAGQAGNTNIEIGLLTSDGCKKFPSKSSPNNWTSISRSQLLKWVSGGQISILIGTHSLIQKTVNFANLALVIIDEQHRFGVKQRKQLAHKLNDNKKELPHLLSMTATPIPRTLALTMFGDLDLTVLDEMPKERKKIITEFIFPSKRTEIYEKVREELQKGRQAYVICPRIDEQDEEEKQKRVLKSVKEEAKRLADEIFPEFVVDILHSKMKSEEKEEVMQDFLNKKSDILVATSVVEVGVNIPNASVIIIEGADRFGLAQLHQLRGRVGRAEHQSYCYLFSDSNSEGTKERLRSLVKAKNGFELAEIDMNNRGIGTLLDGKQWGISDVAMEAIKNPKLVEVAREVAKELVENDPELKKFPELAKIIKEKEKVHME